MSQLLLILRRPHTDVHFVLARRPTVHHGQERFQKVRRRQNAELPFELDQHRQLHLLNDIRRVHVRRPRAKFRHRRHTFLNLFVFHRNLQAAQRDEM